MKQNLRVGGSEAALTAVSLYIMHDGM